MRIEYDSYQMYSEYYELTEGSDDRLVKIRPTRGELAGFSDPRGHVSFEEKKGRFIPIREETVTYQAIYFPLEYPDDDLLEKIAKGSAAFNNERRVFEIVAPERNLMDYDRIHRDEIEERGDVGALVFLTR